MELILFVKVKGSSFLRGKVKRWEEVCEGSRTSTKKKTPDLKKKVWRLER